MKRIFITYGDEQFNVAKQKISVSASSTGEFDVIIAYGRENLSSELLSSDIININRGGGLWSWKPDIILTTMDKFDDGDIIVYCDAGCSLYSSFEWKRYWNILKNKDIIAQRIFQRTECWTRKEILSYFNLDNLKVRRCFQYQATIILKISPFTRDFIREWRDLMIDHPEFVMDVPLQEIPLQYPSFKENRHDQAIYSAMIYNYLLKPTSRNKIYTQWEHIEDLDIFSSQAIRATRLRKGEDEMLSQRVFKALKRIVKDFIFKPFYYAPLQKYYFYSLLKNKKI